MKAWRLEPQPHRSSSGLGIRDGVVSKLLLLFPGSALLPADPDTHTLQNHSGLTQPHQHRPNLSGRLVIEDVKGPEVTLHTLSDSLLQVTLRSKLYLSLQE